MPTRKQLAVLLILSLRFVMMVSGVVLSAGGYYSKIDLFNERSPGEIYRSSPPSSKAGNWSESWILVDDLTLLRGDKITISVYTDHTVYIWNHIDSYNIGLAVYFVEIAHPGEKPDEGHILDVEQLSYNFSGYLKSDESPFWKASREAYFPYDKVCRVYCFVDVSTTVDDSTIVFELDQFDITIKITRSLDGSDTRPCVSTLVLGLVLFSASFMLVQRRRTPNDSDDTVLWSKDRDESSAINC